VVNYSSLSEGEFPPAKVEYSEDTEYNDLSTAIRLDSVKLV